MDCGVEFEDLHAKLVNDTEQVGFGIGTAEEEENLVQVSEREMWLNNTTNDQVDHLLGMNDDASMFYADFPPLPDFPCMSSSSSSSSSSTPLKTIACSTTTTTTSSSSSASSSSAASWALLKSEDGNKMKNHGYDNNMHQNDVSLLDHHHGHANTLSSTASMDISQQQQQQQHENNNIGLSTNDCMDDVIMDTFGYMELLEANEFFDPSSIFQNEDNPLVDFTQEQQQLQVQPQHQGEYHHEHAMVVNDSETKEQQQQGVEEENNVFVCDIVNNEDEIQGEEESGFDGVNDEMSMVFLEWLKSNKDSVSANDLRNVKLKKSTIESAARRLGGGKEGMKQLLKLILEWVQTSHLQNKRHKQNNTTMLSNVLVPQQQQFQDPCQNQNTFAPESTNTCFNQTQWLIDQTPLIVNPPQFSSQPMVGYVGSDPYTNGSVSNNPYNQQHVTNEFQHMLESNNSWGGSQFTIAAASHYNQSFGENNNNNNNNNNMLQHGVSFGGYGNQYPYQFFHGPGDRLMRLGPSATKEARKKRMARQRRFMSHHRNHNNNNNNQHLLNNHQGSDPLGRLGGDNCTNLVAAAGSHGNPPNWMYWQTMAAGGGASLAPVVPAEPPPPQVPVERSTMQAQNCHQGRNASSDRRQGWKPEKNLRFLLQKVLKQSDVGSLGRIVLPKKEAETHLPELEARDGISITMEDIGTSRVWNMRYRYWPNNKSRMYLLENTGDFVKANGLQEGDFIVIYSDVKCGKFMIRGVKVRQQQGGKPEAKKAGKSHKNQHGNNATNSAGTAVANNGTQSSPKRKNEKILN